MNISELLKQQVPAKRKKPVQVEPLADGFQRRVRARQDARKIVEMAKTHVEACVGNNPISTSGLGAWDAADVATFWGMVWELLLEMEGADGKVFPGSSSGSEASRGCRPQPSLGKTTMTAKQRAAFGRSKVPWGKHKGKTIEEVNRVDPGWLEWIVGDEWRDQVAAYLVGGGVEAPF